MKLALLLIGLGLGGTPSEQTWPGFLGQGATKITPETIPLSWSPTENIGWTAKLPGKGQSSPIIWGDHIFVTSIEGSMKDHCHVTALTLDDGRVAWTKSFPASQTIRTNYFQSRSASTPVVDGERLYAFFETGNLIALTHTGNVVWQRSITDDYGLIESSIGLAASPLLVDGMVVLLVDHEGPSYVLAVDAKTGETKWKTDRDSRKSYSSPALVSIGTTRQIVCSSDGSVDGYDPATGKRLWTFGEVGGNTSATPLPFGDGQFLIAATPGMHNEREQAARKSNLCLKVEQVADGFQPTVQWRTEQAMPTFGSPIVFRDHAYWVNRTGVVFCFDVKTGEQRYAQRTKQAIWSTPVGIGDRLYMFGKDGLTTVLASGPEFTILAENQLWDPDKVGSDPFGRERTRGSQAATHEVAAGHTTEGAKPPSTDVKAAPETRNSGGRPAESKQSETAKAPAGEGRRPPLTDKERDEARARGENRFADPIQYGVALVNGNIIIRSGEMVYCVRSRPAQP